MYSGGEPLSLEGSVVSTWYSGGHPLSREGSVVYTKNQVLHHPVISSPKRKAHKVSL